MMSTVTSKNGHGALLPNGLTIVAQPAKKARTGVLKKMAFKRLTPGQTSSPNNKNIVKGKLSMDKYTESQLFQSPLPSYSPGAPSSAFSEEDEAALQFFSCVDCGDQFLFESSLTQHLSRRSVKIRLLRPGETKHEEFYNRCSLLANLRQNSTSGIAGRVSVHPLDKEQLMIPPCAAPISTSDIIQASSFKQGSINSEVNAQEINGKIYPQLEIKQEKVPLKLPVSSKPSTSSTDYTATQSSSQQFRKILPKPSSLHNTECKKSKNVLQSTLNQSSQISECPECNLKLPPKTNLQQHFAGALDNFIYSVKSKLKCNKCQIPLPSVCSLKCHEQIHLPQHKQSNFVCPQCGIKFLDWDIFMNHLHTDCMHAYFTLSFKCQCCFSMFLSSISLEVHILKEHVKKVFKCNICNIACYSQQSLNKHRTETHNNFAGKPTVFQLCELCPGKLISKSVLLFHVHQHGEDSSNSVLRYVCEPCNVFTENVVAFKDHKKICPHTQSKFTNPIPTPAKEETKNEEFINDVQIDDPDECIQDIEVKKEPVEEEIQSIKGKSKSPVKSDSVRPCHKCGSAMQLYKYKTYGCFNCNKKLIKKYNKTSSVKKLQNRSQPTKNEEKSTCDNNNSKLAVQVSCPICSTSISDDYSSVHEHFLNFHVNIVISEISYKEDLNILKEKILTERKQSYRCLLCEIWIKDEEEFREHITAHRPTDNPGFQCLECGMCYVVKPSLEKHLLLAHKIKGVNEYLKESGQEQLDDQGHVVKENQCEVCYAEFDSQQELNTHMRTHGLAFLKNIS